MYIGMSENVEGYCNKKPHTLTQIVSRYVSKSDFYIFALLIRCWLKVIDFKFGKVEISVPAGIVSNSLEYELANGIKETQLLTFVVMQICTLLLLFSSLNYFIALRVVTAGATKQCTNLLFIFA